jgi:ABC-type maltose transport system permease subunit
MDSAKEIARDMLEAINIDGSGFWGAIGKVLFRFHQPCLSGV